MKAQKKTTAIWLIPLFITFLSATEVVLPTAPITQEVEAKKTAIDYSSKNTIDNTITKEDTLGQVSKTSVDEEKLLTTQEVKKDNIKTRFLPEIKTKKCCKRGEKLFRKKFKRRCGYTGARLAQNHTTQEWRDIYDSGKFKEEFDTLCPKRRDTDHELEKSWERAIFKFSECYSSDSANFPAC